MEKSIEDLIKEMNDTPWTFSEKSPTEDYRALALKASLTLPHDGLQGLLTDADRIEKWLWEPIERQRIVREKNFREQLELKNKIANSFLKP